jgi:ribosomal protein S12 methylthiotransferase accessory factor
VTTLPSTIQTAYSLAATETAKWIVTRHNERVEGRIITLDVETLTKHDHQLVRRPQCPACGDAKRVAITQTEPLVLQNRKKIFTSDGGHRLLSPEDTVQKLAHHISPITGIVNLLQSSSFSTQEPLLAPVYIAGHNFIHVARDEVLDWHFLQASVRGASAGKGRQDTQAKASALCEAIERYSGVFQGDEARVRARFSELGDAAIPPNDCMLFSKRQMRNRTVENAAGSPATWAPEPFDANLEIEWSPVGSLTQGRRRYVPTAYCYYGYSRKYQAWFAHADSNGCAAGHCKEEAILQGFLELVQRDGVALWWYNRLGKPVVDLASFAEPYFQELQAYYQIIHRNLWVLDLTSDLDIPIFAALSRRNDQPVEDIIFGFGAHFDPRLAILRALTEVNQALPVVLAGTPDFQGKHPTVDLQLVSWWKNATIDNQPYLIPDRGLAPKRKADYVSRWNDDLSTDVLACVQIAQEKELETLVLDQTRPDTGMHVVKVIVPGLRHFWPRFAPGRLYEVPVHMGWLKEAKTEADLNPQYIYV